MQLIQGDCLEVMKTLPALSVDLILCDLPYGTTQNRWDVVIPFEPLWAQYHRIAKPAAAIVEERGLRQVTDTSAIEKAIDQLGFVQVKDRWKNNTLWKEVIPFGRKLR